MSDITTITLQQRLDRSEIGAALVAGTDLEIRLKNEYAGDLAGDAMLKLSDLDTPGLNAFGTLWDIYSWKFEAMCPVWKVDFDAETKTFDFGRSYLRDAVSTATETALADGAPLRVRFEFAGFLVNEFAEATVLYNEDFSTEDKEALAEFGIDVTAAGTGFSFVNDRPCKVYFFRPDEAEGQYVVQYPSIETIIPV